MLPFGNKTDERYTMEIFVVRHGIAVDSDVDVKRPLSAEGSNQVKAMGQYLKDKIGNIEHVIHSEKLRAIQTAQILHETACPDASISQQIGLSPNDDPDALLDKLPLWEPSVMIVSHLPFVDKLVSQLVTSDIHHSICSFSPGTIVKLNKNNHHATISFILHPGLTN